MAGWDSPVQDPKTVIYRRNKSLTKKAIETYWKSKKTDEEHVGSHSNSTQDGQENQYKGPERRMQRSTSLPLTDRRDSITSNDDSANSGTENLNKPHGW
ncbi:hypothetical protein QJS10_CPB14g00014 [Acorus calamus]|uniref:Uncharacterized protein n=1 Tax=Acorus calamus TaxID=4465 RepID=A0AAV9DAM9_ACOCL|nr:hypothetical protein QJS10_CPB14g00014 [Acorus calamus]